MRIPPIKKLLMEDFPEQASWIGKLLGPLNQFLSIMSDGLNRGLTIQENMLAEIKTVLVTGNNPTVTFTYPFSSAPIGCLIISCRESSQVPVEHPPLTWVYSSGKVTATLSGLNPTKSYFVTFWVIGG